MDETLIERAYRLRKEMLHHQAQRRAVKRESRKPNRNPGKDRGTRRNHPMRLMPYSHAGCAGT